MNKPSPFLTGIRLRLLAAAAAAAVSTFLINREITDTRNQILGLPRSQILVARASMVEGAKVDAKDIEILDIPNVYKHPGAISSAEARQVVGRRLRTTLKAGQPLLWQDFLGPNPERSGRGLTKDMRGVAVTVDEALARSGMLNPHDYVDVLVTFTRNPELKGNLTGTLFQNTKVLDLRGSTALLELPLQDAELLIFVGKHAQVTLVLRNSDDPLSPVPTKNIETVIRRLIDEEESAHGRSSGADLSRYLNTNRTPGPK